VITRANVRPGRLDKLFVDQSAPAAQAQIDRAARLDREADFQLLLGRHAAAERLSHQAIALRATLQISIALAAIGVAHGRIQPGHAMTSGLVQVGMVQTVARRLEAIGEAAEKRAATQRGAA
jgi:hypothetical protein